jgi:site-specific DNA-methyltransferase (adenine-specific)
MSTSQLTLIQGDARYMPEIDHNTIHLIVTSPPYWQIKDYGPRNQIGYHQSYEQYINNLNLVWSESYRVLENGCRLCINIGDQYARAAEYGRYKVIPIRTEIIKFCECIGFDYMGSIIWKKVSTTNTTGGGTVMGSYPYPRNGILKLDYEFILIFKKRGKAPAVESGRKEQSALTNEEWKEYFSGHWNFPGVRQKDHIAMFPEELPRRLIKMFSFTGDHVLDPFMGSGTTMKVAGELNRRCSGYEINKKYISISRKYLGQDVKIVVQNQVQVDFDYLIRNLPYIYKDQNRIRKKPAQNIKAVSRRTYYRVIKVKSPFTLVLSDGKTIKLLGVRPAAGKEKEAEDYLIRNTTGKPVYYTLDEHHNNSRVYLYLKNKTFINAHLIKRGLADVDKRIDFRYKKRFISYVPD